ncbi:MAG: hypothetical protein KF817_01890 [Phycisphaeraceae bacterium]|nr:hypothetical protein [Phycisphaeraceae bacterium]
MSPCPTRPSCPMSLAAAVAAVLLTGATAWSFSGAGPAPSQDPPPAARDGDPAPAGAAPAAGRRARRSDGRAAPGGVADAPPDDLLRGPRVEPEAEAPVRRRRGVAASAPGGASGMGAAEPLPMPEFLAALRGVGLSREQQASVREIVRAHEERVRDFMETHGPEMRRLRQQVQAMRERGPRAASPPMRDGDDTMTPESAPALRERAEALREAMPSPSEAQTRIWALLDDAQRRVLGDRLALRRERARPRPSIPGDGMPGEGMTGDGGTRPARAPRSGADTGEEAAPPPARPRRPLRRDGRAGDDAA